MTAVESLAGVETRRLLSVTTLTDKAFGIGPGLANYIQYSIATAGVDEEEAWKAIKRSAGRDEAIKYLANVRYRKSEQAKLRGSAVHTIAEKLALGTDPGPIEPHLKPYVEQLARWLAHFQPEFLLAEAPVYNPERGYAGTTDGIMLLGGSRVIFDYKTTEHPPGGEKARPPWPEVALQLCAYRRATEVGVLREQVTTERGRYYVYDPTVQHAPMPEVDGALCIVISPYDCRAVPVVTDENVWRAFLVAVAAARWQEETSKHVFRGAVLEAPPNQKEER